MRRLQVLSFVAGTLVLGACAAVLGLPDPTLDEAAGPGTPEGDANADVVVDANSGSDATTADVVAPDANVDGGACDLAGKWGNVTHLDSLASSSDEDMASLTPDEQTIYFRRGLPNGQGSNIMIAHRTDAGTGFDLPQPLPGGPNFPILAAPCITADGARIYYSSNTAGAELDIFWAPMPAAMPQQMEPGLKSAQLDFCGSLAADGTMFLWRQDATTNANLATYFQASFDPATKVYAPPTSIPGFSSLSTPLGPRPVISSNQLTIFYYARLNASSADHIYTARRASKSDPFAQHAKVAELDSAAADGPAWLSPDGCRLYFASTRAGGAGGADLYVASRPAK
ncbi:MAG: OmpA family protein [Labilithrix sp.]|nr:OmpA family protein [Labilithrix sp.]